MMLVLSFWSVALDLTATARIGIAQQENQWSLRPVTNKLCINQRQPKHFQNTPASKTARVIEEEKVHYASTKWATWSLLKDKKSERFTRPDKTHKRLHCSNAEKKGNCPFWKDSEEPKRSIPSREEHSLCDIIATAVDRALTQWQ